MGVAERTVAFLNSRGWTMATAESCTGGRIAALLTEAEGCGACLECGYVVYSPNAKQRELGVNKATIDTFGLTSEEVASEMAKGALAQSGVNVAVATTGVTGDEAMDGVLPGTVWFAWAYQSGAEVEVVTRKKRFFGERQEVQLSSALYALEGLMQCLTST
jgi:PncC family amidohydrolase